MKVYIFSGMDRKLDNLDYGVIGNCRSAALVSRLGDIEWCCLPTFNSSSVFARILDRDIGGEFGIRPEGAYEVTQKYIDMTNILLTRFEWKENIFEIIDFMPIYRTEKGGYYNPPEIIRFFRCIRGKPAFRIVYDPRLNYAEYKVETRLHQDYIKSHSLDGPYESVYLYTNFDKHDVAEGRIIEMDSDGYFLLSYNQKLVRLDVDKINLEYQRTKVYWLNWIDRTIQYRQYNEHIMRSALVLKLLTYQKTGSILAAITTSLPETLNDIRNWDYRFCWVRDSSMIIKALITLGHNNSARNFLNFMVDLVPHKDEKIQIMYGIDGDKQLDEQVLAHLAGYEDSAPVRIGNDAYRQKQNDIYGVLMDVIYMNFKLYLRTLDNVEDLWTLVRGVVRTVQSNWRNPDRGIWEIRSDNQHFVFSKVLCWVAFDRGVKIAGMLRREPYIKEWSESREEIRKDILENGWNDSAGAFTQTYANTDMDAANLLMEPFGFIEPKDTKYVSTVKAIRKELCFNGLMYRYRNADDFGKPTSSFTICSFWMIKALHRIGLEEDSRKMFEQLLGYSNHLGLFSEDIDFESKRLLGNFPQGYSHLALIEAAILLSGQQGDGLRFWMP